MKERSLRGVHQGQRLVLGYLDNKEVVVTIWSGMLLLARNKMPHPLIREWKGRYIAGGMFWKEVPHPFVKNPLNLILYEDTLLNTITCKARYLLMPGQNVKTLAWEVTQTLIDSLRRKAHYFIWGSEN